VAQAVANATVNQLNAAIQAGTPCAVGQSMDANGNCYTPFSMPWWGWAIIAGVGVLVVVKQ
jgi:hypothetical protein